MNEKLIRKFIKAIDLYNLLEDNYFISYKYNSDTFDMVISLPNEKIIPICMLYDRMPSWTVNRIIKWFRKLVDEFE